MNPFSGHRFNSEANSRLDVRSRSWQSISKATSNPRWQEAWEVSKDGKVYTIRLRKGVKFHNGQEMTAEDAKFAIDYSMNEKNGARGFAELSIVRSRRGA
jgi:ABC-type transport system substrate-binding protein